MENTAQKFIIFLHIQKTGGITIQRILRQKFGPSIVTRSFNLLIGRDQPTLLENSLRSRQMGHRYFAGHVCFGVHSLLPQPFTYITLLRDPVSRIISLYYFSRSNPKAFYHNIAITRTLEEFALSTNIPELDNGQVRFLAGDSTDYFINQTPVNECTDELLKTAISNVENYFSLVGLTEYFDHSILLLSRKMGWRHPYYLRLNSGKAKNSVSDELTEKISKRNSLDVELYNFMKENLFKDLEKYNLSDGIELNTFKRQNSQFNKYFAKPYSFYHNSKSFLRGQPYRP